MSEISDRIESAIEKLTSISVDLKTLIAVHEQRISQQEKTSGDLQVSMERRREELDIKLKDVYNTMRDQDNNIIQEITKLREESSQQHNILSGKIASLEKYIYIAIGVGMVVTWILTNAVNYLKLLH